MSAQAIGLIGMAALIVMIFLRIPVAVGMGLVGFVGYVAVNGFANARTVLGQVPFDMGSSYSLAQVPLFILMGDLAMNSGLSAKLYGAARAAFMGIKGSQAFATIGACAGFGSVSGSSVATAATMTRIAMPEMRRAGYDDRLSTGSIAAGGSLGILIPPSIPLVIYGLIAEQSVTKLYAAAMIPGLVLTLLYMLCVIPVLFLYPHWVPVEAGTMSWRQRLAAVGDAWAVLVLLLFVLGGMYVGWFTATEAAAVGCLMTFLIGIFFGDLSWRLTLQSFTDTIRTTCMLFVIVFSAVLFTYFIVLTKLPDSLVVWITSLGFGPVTIIVLMMVFYIVLGCFMEAFGIMLITVPIFLPLVVQSGYDAIWFGVMLVIVIELGMIHPPMGMNIFVMQAQLPEIPVTRLYAGIVPFLPAPIVLLGVLIAWPEIATWLAAVVSPPH
jgi:C4-dicarboxylate transporter DctM subunit